MALSGGVLPRTSEQALDIRAELSQDCGWKPVEEGADRRGDEEALIGSIDWLYGRSDALSTSGR